MELVWKRNLFIVWISVFFSNMAYSLSMPFLPIFLQDELGVREDLAAWSGVAFSVSFLASILMAPFWGSLADKYGRKLMLLRAGFSLSAAFIINYFIYDPYVFIFWRIVAGLMAGFVPVAMALIATNTPEKHAGYALGVISTGSAAGNIIGPFVGGVLSHWLGTRECFVISGCVMLSSALSCLLVKEIHRVTGGKRSSVFQDLKQAAGNPAFMWIFGIMGLISTSVMILEPLLTIYVVEIGGSAHGATLSSGIIFSAVGIATVIMGSVWGKLGQRIGYEKTLFIGLIGGGIGNMLQLGIHHLVGFGILRFGFGLFFAAVYPALNALIIKHTDEGFRGRAFSLNQTASQFGMMAGPLLGGFLGGWISIPFVFLFTGAVLLGAACLLRMNRAMYEGRQESGDAIAADS